MQTQHRCLPSKNKGTENKKNHQKYINQQHLGHMEHRNSIPAAAVHEANSVSSFKRKLKTHYFSVCFDDF